MPKGKHPEKALNARLIKNLSEPGRYTDGNGLYLIVDHSEAKRWVLRTVVHGRRRDMGLGGLATVSLAEARQLAQSYRGVARSGGDPLANRKEATATIPTFEEAAWNVHKRRLPPLSVILGSSPANLRQITTPIGVSLCVQYPFRRDTPYCQPLWKVNVLQFNGASTRNNKKHFVFDVKSFYIPILSKRLLS